MRVRPRPSRTLALWWATVHGLAALGVVASALPWPLAALALAALLGHSCLRRPRPAEPLDLCGGGGGWGLPASGLTGLTLAEGTALGSFWVKLVLAPSIEGQGRETGSEGRRNGGTGARARKVCLLLRDQLDAETWRALQAELRRGARSGAH